MSSWIQQHREAAAPPPHCFSERSCWGQVLTAVPCETEGTSLLLFKHGVEFYSTLSAVAWCLLLLFLSGNVKKWPRKAVLCFAAEHVALGFLLTNGASPGLGEEEGKLKCSCQGKSHNSHVCIISASPNMSSRWEEQPPHPRELRCLYNMCRACFWSALSADVQILVFERLYRTEHVWIPVWCWWHSYNYMKSSVGAKANKAISSNHKNART